VPGATPALLPTFLSSVPDHAGRGKGAGMSGRYILACAAVAALVAAAGCASQRPVSMAPPIGPAPQVGMAPPGGMQPAGAPSMGVYQWQDVPQGQQVPVSRATFDQGGYQVYAASGETIVVPFANQNLYAMKFGRSYTGQ